MNIEILKSKIQLENDKVLLLPFENPRNQELKEIIFEKEIWEFMGMNMKNEKELFIIGGGQIYQEALSKKLIDKMYVTHVDHTFEADTFFPKINPQEWKKTSEEKYQADDKHSYSYSFAVYEKIN